MKLQLNGIAIDTDVTTLATLLDEQGFAEAKVATAVNGQFVPEALRNAQILDEGDLIEVLAPMQGG